MQLHQTKRYESSGESNSLQTNHPAVQVSSAVQQGALSKTPRTDSRAEQDPVYGANEQLNVSSPATNPEPTQFLLRAPSALT
jgi:hypothetical protein